MVNSAVFGRRINDGEFDPGSERTLAARLKHASRANRFLRGAGSGGRVSNTWMTCPAVWNSLWKHGVMPDETACVVAGREYGRQQLRIFHNGRKPDGATPRERRRP